MVIVSKSVFQKVHENKPALSLQLFFDTTYMNKVL